MKEQEIEQKYLFKVQFVFNVLQFLHMLTYWPVLH